MPSVGDLTAAYGNFMLGPRHGPGVCEICLNLTDGYQRCYACSHGELCLDAVLPISYSVGREQLHHVLRSYKRLEGEPGRRLRVELAAVLWRFLKRHELCVATAAGTSGFELVTTVPSSDTARDQDHPLRTIVGELVTPARARYQRLLARTSAHAPAHEFSADRFEATRELTGSVLLIDDTWTTGANAQSAAAALKRAGAEIVAAVVIGRYLNREWRENDRRLRSLERPFNWERCALCRAPATRHSR